MRRWWSKTQGIPDEAYATWRSSLAEKPGRPPRVLAWGPTADDGVVVLSPAAVSLRDLDGWRHVGWHEIERGGWNGETRQLRWRTYDGARGIAIIAEPGRIPEVFKERVAASIVYERLLPISPGGNRGVVVSGRRDLADPPSPITWHATLTRGVTWHTPGVREFADLALAQVRDEYDER